MRIYPTSQRPKNKKTTNLFHYSSIYKWGDQLKTAKRKTECEFIQHSNDPRKRKSSNCSTMHLVDGTTSEAHDFYPTACQDCYRVMYSIVLDPVWTSLKHPFHNSSVVVYENIESLLLKTIKGEDTSDESEYIKRI